MARSKSQSESSAAGQPASLDKIDAVIRQAYDQVKSSLDEVEAKLSDLETQRKSLADRARQLEFALGIGDVEAPEADSEATSAEPAATTAAATQAEDAPEAPAAPARGKRGGARQSKRGAGKSSPASRGKKRGGGGGGRKRARGALWNDVQDVMKGKGKMQASKVIEALVAKKDYEDTEKVRTRVYNSLGRWAREGKLSKSARGVYSI